MSDPRRRSRPMYWLRAAASVTSVVAVMAGGALVASTGAAAAEATTTTGTVSSNKSVYVDLAANTTVSGELTWDNPSADLKLSLRGPGGVVLATNYSTAKPKVITHTVGSAGRYRFYMTTKVSTAFKLKHTVGSATTAPIETASPTATPTATATTSTGVPPARSGGLTSPTTRTLTSSAFLSEARSEGLVENVTITGSVVLNDPRDTWTCRNCRVLASSNYGIQSFYNTSNVPSNGRGTRWENSEVDARGISSTAVVGSYLTWVDGNVHSATSDLFKPFKYFTVLRGQAHSILKADGAHADVIQIVNGRNVLIDGLWADAREPDGTNVNAVLQMGSLNGDVTNVVLRNMYANGGHYTLRGISSTAAESSHTVTDFRIENNWLGPDHTYGPLYGTGPRTTVSGNKWGFTGTTNSTKPRSVVLGQLV